MLLAESGCLFMLFILYVSGVQGQDNSICALKGSSVDLPCSAKHPTSNMKWYTVHWDGFKNVQKELPADGIHVTYNKYKENHLTLTINNVTERDEKLYCCRENPHWGDFCMLNGIRLHVADLQVKVIPTTEGQTVSLMCSTSCPLTENPAAYIWHKNGEFLYEDWSPWYQELVSSEEAVRYSCAVKGYEDLRAPDVSVDSVTSACFSVTYAEGRMCLNKQTSVKKPCTITYPREVHVLQTESDYFPLTCSTSCALTAQTAYGLYQGRTHYSNSLRLQFPSYYKFDETFSCAVKDHKYLRSAEACVNFRNCWSVNYTTRRICALEGSSVNISSEYSYPENQQPKSKVWYKIKRSVKEEAGERSEAARRAENHDNMKNHHILTIKSLVMKDSAEYIFRLQQDDGQWKVLSFPGVTLIVTGLTVKFTPSSVVTEGQRVTLTCSTSCPLTDNTNYIWYLNSRPLTQPENQHKHLVLDPVSSQHAGSYSCAVKSHNNIRAPEKTLTIRSKMEIWMLAVGLGVGAVLLVVSLAVYLWIRRKRTSSQPVRTETSNNMDELHPGPVYDNILPHSTEQDDLHYSRVHLFNNRAVALYSTIQPHQPQQQEHVPYAVVNFRQKNDP